MKATIRDVAQQAGVSETTVSLAFKPKSRISAATRQKVLETARKLKYVANEAARNLRHGGLKTLSVLVNDLTNPFYASMVRMVEMVAEESGYHVMVMESQWDGEREVQSISRMLQARVQGVIICSTEQTGEGFELLQQYNVPYIALDTFPLGYKGSYVANDMAATGRLAVEHLFACRCRNVALIMPVMDEQNQKRFSSFSRLEEGFSEMAKQLGLSFGPDAIFSAGLTIEEGRRIVPYVLEKISDVDGILCGNDLCALGAMEAFDQCGLRVGHDVAVVGIDDLAVSGLARISLTSVRQPYAAISKLATEAIIEAAETGKEASISEMMAPTLVPRQSTQARIDTTIQETQS